MLSCRELAACLAFGYILNHEKFRNKVELTLFQIRRQPSQRSRHHNSGFLTSEKSKGWGGVGGVGGWGRSLTPHTPHTPLPPSAYTMREKSGTIYYCSSPFF
ncbi:hypothetical protein [Nostoc sp.]|uniref:hypothetical protein n=1 Tax=Nostoc sp. TaxID=1180 RepID=UPI002FFB9C36